MSIETVIGINKKAVVYVCVWKRKECVVCFYERVCKRAIRDKTSQFSYHCPTCALEVPHSSYWRVVSIRIYISLLLFTEYECVCTYAIRLRNCDTSWLIVLTLIFTIFISHLASTYSLVHSRRQCNKAHLECFYMSTHTCTGNESYINSRSK